MARVSMDSETHEKVVGNIFPSALGAVEPWDSFPWHPDGGNCDTWKRHSSQALAIDVFGTLMMASEQQRDAALGALARSLGLPDAGPWTIGLEWQDPQNRLHETRQTQVDALARSPSTVIYFECKFTEADGGACSQVQPLPSGRHRGAVQCDGHHRLQVNPVNGHTAECSLTGKSIRYWDVIPNVFQHVPGSENDRCPFSGPWFQWMRNLVSCYEVGKADDLQPAFVVMYADAPGLAFAERVRSEEWRQLTDQVRPEAVTFQACSYQSFLSMVRESPSPAAADSSLWQALEEWVARKIAAVTDNAEA